MCAQVGSCESFRPFLVIGFAPQKVARAHCWAAARRRACSALPEADPLARLALLVALGALVVTRATLVGARATLLALPVVFARKCRGYDRKRQLVTHRRQPASDCDSLPEGKEEFCYNKTARGARSRSPRDRSRELRAQRLRLIRPLSAAQQVVSTNALSDSRPWQRPSTAKFGSLLDPDGLRERPAPEFAGAALCH